MPALSSILLYVAKPAASAAFYEKLLQRPPLDCSENFAMFALDGGPMLGLWAAHDVMPAPLATAGASEVMFAASEKAEVDALYAEWMARGVSMLQMPEQMDFGYTFTAQDIDGHRLRVAYIPQ